MTWDGEVADVFDLAAGEAGRPQVLLAHLEQLLRGRGGAAEEVEDPPVDRSRRFRRELLADDRPQQGSVGVGRPLLLRRRNLVARSISPTRSISAAISGPVAASALLSRAAHVRAHRPVQRGLRFSAKAWIPSRKSSEPKHDSRRETSSASCAWAEHRVRVERLDRLLVAAHRERRVGRDRRRQLDPGFLELVVGDDLVDEADLLGPFGLEVAPGQEQLLGARQADRVEELAEAGVAVDQPQFRRRHPQLRPGRADPHVAGDRQLEAAAEAVAVDHRHGRPGVGGERLHRSVEGVGDEGLGVALEGLFGDRADVVPGREDRRRAGDQDAAVLDPASRAAAASPPARRGSRGRGRCGARGWRS